MITSFATKHKESLMSPFLLFVLSLIWGSSFILYKISLVAIPAMEVGAVRVFTAFVMLLPVAIKHLRHIPIKNYKWLIASGLLGVFIPAMLFALAGSKMPSSVIGSLNALTPGLTVVVGVLIFRTPIKLLQIFGLILALIGSLVLALQVGTGGLEVNAYAILVFLGCLCYAVNLNITKTYLSHLPAVVVSACTLAFIGLPALTIILLGTGVKACLVDASLFVQYLLPAIALGALGSAAASILFYKLIKLSSALYASTVTYLMPLIAIFWGLLDGEQFLYWHLLGALLILVGVVMVNRKKYKNL